jgi:hypothetical protein
MVEGDNSKLKFNINNLFNIIMGRWGGGVKLIFSRNLPENLLSPILMATKWKSG